jgi:hypothetical protein
MIVDWAGAIETKNDAKSERLGKIWINGEEFSGIAYQGLMTVNTKTYVEEPVRQNDGSMANIDDHDTFIVPRCKVNFKFFNIRDYQRLCRVINSGNQFPVKYFDKQFGTFVTHYMYVEPEEMAKIYNVGTSVIGIIDYEVSFIGTLNSLEKFSVKYEPKYLISGNYVDLVPKTIGAYSETTTYSKDMVVSVTTDDVTDYYKYKNETSASGKKVTDTAYWTKISKGMKEVEKVSWGHSVSILKFSDLTNFYEIPAGKTIKGWNTLADGTGLNILPNSKWSVFEDTTIYPIIGE